jgi:hypothetical protein
MLDHVELGPSLGGKDHSTGAGNPYFLATD